MKDIDFTRRQIMVREGKGDTVQELLGHADVRTTQIDTHVLQRGACGVQSPLDRL